MSSSLAPDHLLAIFRCLPPGTLLRLPLVTSTWASLQPTACRQVRTLTLRLRGPNHRAPLFPLSFPLSRTLLHLTSLYLHPPMKGATSSTSPLSVCIVESLLSLFPLLAHLNVEYIGPTLPLPVSSVHLSDLLRGWAATLVRLGLYGFSGLLELAPEQEATCASLRHLLATINTSLAALHALTIDLGNHFFPRRSGWPVVHPAEDTLHLPILTRLRSFSFASLDPADILLSSFLEYAAAGNGSLTEIRLGLTSSLPTETLLSLEHSPVLPKITSYGYYASSEPFRGEPPLSTLPDLRLIGRHFTQLTCLFLLIDKRSPYSLSALLHSLSKLANLSTLQLTCPLKAFPQATGERLSELPFLPRVTSLYLSIDTLQPLERDSSLLRRLPLGLLFPSLTFASLKYGYSFTVQCTTFEADDLRKYARSCVNCDAQVFGTKRPTSFRTVLAPAYLKCPKLPTIAIETVGNPQPVDHPENPPFPLEREESSPPKKEEPGLRFRGNGYIFYASLIAFIYLSINQAALS